jgi:hypothetical protein
MKKSPVDRRTEVRQPFQGEVRLRQAGAAGGAFMGRLVDLSPHGFRTRHACLTLGSGDRVDFEFQGRSGAARAMWTRIVDSEAETGFNILREAG